MHLLCLLLLGLPTGPYVRWIDVKGDIHVDLVREVLLESPSEVHVRLTDGSQTTVRTARLLDMVREDGEKEEQRLLLAARRDVEAGLRADEAKKTLDRLAHDGSEPWIREYAAAARALLAERTREDDADGRLETFARDYPRSRFLSDCIIARARIRGRAKGVEVPRGLEELRVGKNRVTEIDGPLALRFRMLRDGMDLMLDGNPDMIESVFDGMHDAMRQEAGDGKDYGAYLLVEADAKWAQLLEQQKLAAADEAKGRKPVGALVEVKRLHARAGLDLPDVRCDLEQELGRLMFLCDDKEGARGAWERARDLAPDPRRREAAEEALRKLGP